MRIVVLCLACIKACYVAGGAKVARLAFTTWWSVLPPIVELALLAVHAGGESQRGSLVGINIRGMGGGDRW